MKEAILLRDKKNLFCLEAKVSFEFEFESKISVLQSESNGEKENWRQPLFFRFQISNLELNTNEMEALFLSLSSLPFSFVFALVWNNSILPLVNIDYFLSQGNA